MERDLPGQAVFPFAAEAPQPDCKPSAEDVLPLPQKATCNPVEAAKALGISARQVHYLVEQGTLLAINIGREVASGNAEARRVPWRIVVRRASDQHGGSFDAFMTLEEFIRRRANTEG